MDGLGCGLALKFGNYLFVKAQQYTCGQSSFLNVIKKRQGLQITVTEENQPNFFRKTPVTQG
jgi:hypothetical protein